MDRLFFMNRIPPVSGIVVLSIGGSLVVPKQGIDAGFLRELRRFVLRQIRRGRRLILVVGGGHTARAYQQAAVRIVKLPPDDMDWIGIHATRLNGQLLRNILRDVAQHVVLKDPTRPVTWNRPVLIAAGWKPGWSTDYAAVRLAHRFASKLVLNLSNIDAVYDRDPYRHEDAKKLEAISWSEFRKLVGSSWEPGTNAPFDPIASKRAAAWKMTVVVAGKRLANIEKVLDGSPFRGTVISE